MKINEYGKRNGKKIMLLPGNFCCFRMFSELIPLLSEKYHIIAVSLDGYDETGKTEFRPFKIQAKKLIKVIKEKYDGHIDLIFGESIGCGAAVYMAHSDEIKVGTTVLSGAECLDFGIFNPLMLEMIAAGQTKMLRGIGSDGVKLPAYALKMMGQTNENISRITRGMAKGITRNSVRISDWEGMTLYKKVAGLEPKPSANVVCWYGEKEGGMKRAVKKLCGLFPNMKENVFIGYGHGEILLHPDVMADGIKKLIEN